MSDKLSAQAGFIDYKWLRRLMFWSSDEGKEYCLCLVAQGYEEEVFNIFVSLYFGGFMAYLRLKEFRKVVEE